MSKAVRAPHLAPTVCFVNGIPGCGKTLFSAIVSSLGRVEIEKYDYPLEYSLQLRFLGRLEPDGAEVMARMLTDLNLYNTMMSRETNFRYSDLSSAFRNPRPWRYFQRLFQAGDAAVLPRIESERPILQLVTHNLLSIGAPLFSALGDRLRFIETVRHPLYMLKQWRLYIERYGVDARDLTLWHEGPGGRSVPWFAHGWEELYLASNPMDRVIRSIDRLLKLSDAVTAALPPESRARLLTLPFERFVLDPEPYMRRLCEFLGTREIPETRRELRKQKVPRRLIAEGIDLAIYRDNGWQPPQGGGEAAELDLRHRYAAAEASSEGLALLKRLCADYERRYDWSGAPRAQGAAA